MFGLGIAPSLSYVLLMVGAMLVAAETVVPGAQFIVVGVALFVTGLVGVATPVGGSVAGVLVAFLAASALTIYGYKRLDIYNVDEDGAQTSDSSSLEYQEAVVRERVTRDAGVVEMLSVSSGFTNRFQARSSDDPIEEGQRVLVTDAGGGSILQVVPNETQTETAPASYADMEQTDANLEEETNSD